MFIPSLQEYVDEMIIKHKKQVTIEETENAQFVNTGTYHFIVKTVKHLHRCWIIKNLCKMLISDYNAERLRKVLCNILLKQCCYKILTQIVI